MDVRSGCRFARRRRSTYRIARASLRINGIRIRTTQADGGRLSVSISRSLFKGRLYPVHLPLLRRQIDPDGIVFSGAASPRFAFSGSRARASLVLGCCFGGWPVVLKSKHPLT